MKRTIFSVIAFALLLLTAAAPGVLAAQAVAAGGDITLGPRPLFLAQDMG